MGRVDGRLRRGRETLARWAARGARVAPWHASRESHSRPRCEHTGAPRTFRARAPGLDKGDGECTVTAMLRLVQENVPRGRASWSDPRDRPGASKRSDGEATMAGRGN